MEVTEEVVRKYLPVARRVARKVWLRGNRVLDLGDLIGQASAELPAALADLDPARLSTLREGQFVVSRLMSRLLDYIRTRLGRKNPQKMRVALAKPFSALVERRAKSGDRFCLDDLLPVPAGPRQDEMELARLLAAKLDLSPRLAAALRLFVRHGFWGMDNTRKVMAEMGVGKSAVSAMRNELFDELRKLGRQRVEQILRGDE